MSLNVQTIASAQAAAEMTSSLTELQSLLLLMCFWRPSFSHMRSEHFSSSAKSNLQRHHPTLMQEGPGLDLISSCDSAPSWPLSPQALNHDITPGLFSEIPVF